METQTQLSNLQIELLKLYSNNVPEEQLLDIKNMLAKYFAKKLDEKTDEFWNENKLTPKDMKKWANEHNRVR